MKDDNERLRAIENGHAKISVSLENIDARLKSHINKIESIAVQTYKNKEQLDRWDGGVTLLVKVVGVISVLIGTIILLAEYTYK